MKALVYTAPEKVVYRDCDEPRPKKGELLVKITNVGICGSDMHAYLGHDDRRPAPLILGAMKHPELLKKERKKESGL